MITTTRRVAITGLGLMCGQGLDLDTAWPALAGGTDRAARFTLFDPSELGCTFGVELPSGVDDLFAKHIMTRNRRQMTRATMMALTAARMAFENAGLVLSDIDTRRVGVVIGATGTGYAPTTLEADEHRILRNMANAGASWISLKEKILGPSLTLSTACSSGAYALHTAFSLIASGECDVVLAGASDSSINYHDVAGFCALRALSERVQEPHKASRPFDVGRDGFVMGEGCGMLVVESIEHARRRRAAPYAFMSLPGLVSEAYNILSPQPDGSGMAAAMQRALANAGLLPVSIDYLNAHGTSTPLNDRLEAQAIHTVFGNHADTLAVSSTKSMTGHCLSAAAAIEAVICCMSLKTQIAPPTTHLTDPDPECNLNHVALTARHMKIDVAMSNSFAFGGHNGVCLFSRHE